MSLRSDTKDENPEFVIPAWIAGIQVCKDASGDIHVNLDYSSPCWNDGIEGLCLTERSVSMGIFARAHEVHEEIFRAKSAKYAKKSKKYLVFDSPALAE